MCGEQGRVRLKAGGLRLKLHTSGEQANCLKELLVIISTVLSHTVSGLAIHATSGLFVDKPEIWTNMAVPSRTQLPARSLTVKPPGEDNHVRLVPNKVVEKVRPRNEF